MPHLIVEYSSSLVPALNVETLLQDLHTTLAAQDTVDIDRIKTRAIALGHDHVIVGQKGFGAGMVHVTIKLLPRPDDLAKTIATAIHTATRRHVPTDCAVTVETMTLNANSYCA